MDRINKIKSNVINSLCDEYVGDLTKAEADMLFNCYVTENDFIPKKEYKGEYIEEDRLFGQTPSFIRKYLLDLEAKFGEGTLEQRWSGYEDNYFVYEYMGVEDDDTVENRIYDHVNKEADRYIKEKERKEAKKKRIKELEKELAELKRND